MVLAAISLHLANAFAVAQEHGELLFWGHVVSEDEGAEEELLENLDHR